METNFNFKCPICGKKVLKSNGVKLMWTTIKIKIGTEKDGISDAVFIILGKTKNCNQITITDFEC